MLSSLGPMPGPRKPTAGNKGGQLPAPGQRSASSGGAPGWADGGLGPGAPRFTSTRPNGRTQYTKNRDPRRRRGNRCRRLVPPEEGTCGVHSPSLPCSSAAPTPDHRLGSLPASGRRALPGYSSRPPTAVARAWAEPGGAHPAEPAPSAVAPLRPRRWAPRSPAAPAVKGARPTRQRPRARKRRDSVVLKAGDPSNGVLRFECLWPISAFVVGLPGGRGALRGVAPTCRR